jgi:hypothetical protein
VVPTKCTLELCVDRTEDLARTKEESIITIIGYSSDRFFSKKCSHGRAADPELPIFFIEETDIERIKEKRVHKQQSQPLLVDDNAKNRQPVDNSRGEKSWPNISQWIANALADMDVKVVYGGHGGALVPMVSAVCEHPQLQWVSTRNEHNAAEMAAAQAKFTGKLGVVIATSGPGATNLTTGLLEGVYDKVPMLAITGMKPTQQVIVHTVVLMLCTKY